MHWWAVKKVNNVLLCVSFGFFFLTFFSCFTTSVLYQNFVLLWLKKRSSGRFSLMLVITNMLIIRNEIVKTIVWFWIPGNCFLLTSKHTTPLLSLTGCNNTYCWLACWDLLAESQDLQLAGLVSIYMRCNLSLRHEDVPAKCCSTSQKPYEYLMRVLW